MTIQLISTQQLAVQSGVKILVYGKAGVGKTTLCATAPAPVILSAEAGLLPLRDYNIPVIQIRTVEDLMEAHRWAESSAEAQQFQTICIDSLTEVGEVVLANAKQIVKDPRQAYSELIEKMGRTIRAFRDLDGKHVYMAAKQDLVKDESTGVTLSGPSMPGVKLAQQLPYLFDEVFHLGVNKDKNGNTFRFFRTEPDLQVEAKDRSGRLDPVEFPDLTYIINKILEVRSYEEP
jgi:hypothetical protein